MNKRDFLNELKNALEGKLPESDIREIISDYGDIFDNGTEDGRSEEDVSREIGSPARIARTILEDGPDAGRKSREAGKDFSDRDKGGREYTDFQKNINEKTNKIFDKITEPDQGVDIEQLAPMSRRLGAYIIDSLLLGAIGLGLLFAVLAPFSYVTLTGVRVSNAPVEHIGNLMIRDGIFDGGIFPWFATANIVGILLFLGASNLFTTIFLWATNGYTPGKWLLKMRVVKTAGGKIGFLDALLRELVIKSIANSLLSGFLNLISFIWGCVTDDHKTVHDLVARTRVVTWDKTERKQWTRS